MTEGGANETTPIVHDGVMFLVSAGNTVQAINAVTGECLWHEQYRSLAAHRRPSR